MTKYKSSVSKLILRAEWLHLFNYWIEDLERDYLQVTHNKKSRLFVDSIKIFNALKRKKYLDIIYPYELFKLVKRVIQEEFTLWVQTGGFKYIQDFKGVGKSKREKTYQQGKMEDFAQKTIKPLLEKFLLEKGLRSNDIQSFVPQIYREVEGPDNKRIDMIISYGTVGSILVEIKFDHNKDFFPKNWPSYKEKMMDYLQQGNCSHGIYLILRVFGSGENGGTKLVRFEEKIDEQQILYNDTTIDVIGINCIR